MKRSARLARLKMMTPTSLLRFSAFALGVTAVLLVGGCRKSTTSYNQDVPPQPAPVARPASEEPDSNDAARREEAIRTVTDYVIALTNGKYRTAYEKLSRDSQELHSLAEFERQGRQGMTSLDLDTAYVDTSDEEMVIAVKLLEDSGTAGFHLVREDGAWKILYRGGSPSMPSPMMPSGGSQQGDNHESNSQ